MESLTIEEQEQWKSEHTVHIPASMCQPDDVDITVGDAGDESVRIYVLASRGRSPGQRRSIHAYLTVEQARRLSDLLLSSSDGN